MIKAASSRPRPRPPPPLNKSRLEPPEADAAALLGDVDRAEAERRRLADRVAGEDMLLVPLRRVRGDRVGGEGPRHLLDLALLVGEVKLAHPRALANAAGIAIARVQVSILRAARIATAAVIIPPVRNVSRSSRSFSSVRRLTSACLISERKLTSVSLRSVVVAMEWSTMSPIASASASAWATLHPPASNRFTKVWVSKATRAFMRQ